MPTTDWPTAHRSTSPLAAAAPDMRSAMQARDWRAVPTGAPDAWPASLRVVVDLMLGARFPMCLGWGEDLTFFYNDAYAPFLGQRHPAALGQPLREAWPDVWPDIEPLVAQALAGEAVWLEDLPLTMTRNGDAEETFWTFSYSPVRDESGRIAGFLDIATETTTKVRTERRLTADHRLLSQMFEQAPSFMAMLRGRDHVIELANPGYLSLLPGTDVVGKPAGEGLSETARAGYVKLLDQVFDSGVAFTARGARFPGRDGAGERYLDFVLQPTTDESGEVSGIFVQAVDVTERQQGEVALRESEERYRQIVEGAEDFAIVSFDADDRIASWNSGAERLVGFTEEEAIGQKSDIIFTMEDRTAGVPAREIERARAEGRAVDERWHVRKDGTRFWGSGLMMRREGGLVKIFRDRTAEHDAEGRVQQLNQTLEEQVRERTAALLQSQEALRQSQKLEAVGQLTGGVAHDFNNLLTIIRSAVDFLKRDNLPAAKRNRYIEAISDTVDRATKLTGQLLAFARRQPLKPEIFDLSVHVADVIELVRPIVGARVALSLDPCLEPCFAEADVSQFETAMINLAVNARDAMEGEGALHFCVRHASEVPSIRGHARAEGDFVAASVTDTGSGIAPENMAQIFEPFFTTKQVGKGTGLGLSQVFGFAKQSGGEVDVESTPGVGSTFTIYLPRVAPERLARDAATEPQELAPPARDLCILVVEDNEAVGQFATEMLHDLGYSTTWVGNAAEALNRLGDDGAGFDAVFSDVIMPGMNGVELAEQIRQRHPRLPVVLTSGYSSVLAEEGSHGFPLLKKPYSVEALAQLLHHTVGAPAARGQR